MGVKDGCQATPVLVTVASGLLVLANACSWLSFTTTSWGFTDSTYHEGYGLWRKCSEQSTCYFLDGTRLDWYQVFQGFGVLGFVSLNVATLLVILFMFVGGCRGNGEVIVGAIITYFAGAAFWVVSVILFEDRWHELITSAGTETYLSFSFYLAIAASGLSVVAALLICAAMGYAWKCSRAKVQATNA